MIGIQLKMLPVTFSFVGAGLACYNNFYVILMEGGVGKNGSTVAVSHVCCLHSTCLSVMKCSADCQLFVFSLCAVTHCAVCANHGEI